MGRDSDDSVHGGVNAGRAAIFDLDGTLLDSMNVWTQIDIDFFAERGIEIPDDYMAKVATMQSRQVAVYTKRRFGLPDAVEDLMTLWNSMAVKVYTTSVEAKPHAHEYLEYLHDSGADLAVATALPASMYKPAMAHVGIDRYFDVRVSAEDAGDADKTSPDVYLLAAARLGVQPGNCTVFEDLLPAVRAARRGGMHVWAMLDKASQSDWPSIRREADGAIDDYADAPKVL